MHLDRKKSHNHTRDFLIHLRIYLARRAKLFVRRVYEYPDRLSRSPTNKASMFPGLLLLKRMDEAEYSTTASASLVYSFGDLRISD